MYKIYLMAIYIDLKETKVPYKKSGFFWDMYVNLTTFINDEKEPYFFTSSTDI